MVAEGENFGGDDFYGTDTLVTDAVSETTVVYGAGWGAATVDCGVNTGGNLGGREGGGGDFSTAGGAGMARLRGSAVCFISFYVSSPNYKELTVGSGSYSRVMMSLID